MRIYRTKLHVHQDDCLNGGGLEGGGEGGRGSWVVGRTSWVVASCVVRRASWVFAKRVDKKEWQMTSTKFTFLQSSVLCSPNVLSYPTLNS